MSDPRQFMDEKKVVAFTRKLIQTPSLSLEEKDISAVIRDEMQSLGYDEVWVDELYNVVGVIKGNGSGPTLMFNGHIDHAGLGDMPDPFSAKIISGDYLGLNEDCIYGRGAVDMKGAVGAMVQAAGAVKQTGASLSGDVLVTCVSREEMAWGEGILNLLKNGLTADFAVSGEPSNLKVKLGHRGKWEAKVTVTGRTSHGGFPEGGINAIFKMNNFINTLRAEQDLPVHEFLGKATTTVIDINASPGALTPIVPDKCELIVDRRFFPEDTEEYLLGWIQSMLDRIKATDPEFQAEAETPQVFSGHVHRTRRTDRQGHAKGQGRDHGRSGRPERLVLRRGRYIHQQGRHPLRRIRPGRRIPGPHPQGSPAGLPAGGSEPGLRPTDPGRVRLKN